MSLLNEKVVLVSGGTQGVGAGIVRAAAREGAHVAFTGRRPDAGNRLVAELGSDVASFVQADLADPEQALARSARLSSSTAGSTAWSTPPGSPHGAHSSTPPPPCSTPKLP